METSEQNVDFAQYLTFRLADECYGIEVHKVREILDVVNITKVPRAPEFMLGVINLRGHVVPVVDLRRRFGLPQSDQSKDSCIVVLEVLFGDELLTVGVLGDAVEEVLDLDSSQIEPPPRIGTQLDIEFIQGMGKQGEQFVILLDIDRIFSSEELSLIQGDEEVAS